MNIDCSMKINLTLRVTGLRSDGYHDLSSVFIKILSGEKVYIKENELSDHDAVEMSGLDIEVQGENIALKALRIARELGANIPALYIKIFKAVRPGSGLGAGSGNAAAVIKFLAENYKLDNALCFEIARCTGADVPFLLADYDIALVTGIGDVIRPLDLNLNFNYGCVSAGQKNFSIELVRPDWSIGTREAYAAIDAN